MIRESQLAVMKKCKDLSLSGKLPFPEVVSRLMEAGVERYHVDFSRDEITYYLPSGASEVFPASHSDEGVSIADAFDAPSVSRAIRSAQAGEIVYPEFARRIKAAGCVGYFAQLSGRRVLYFGRDGDAHVEPFPTAEP